MIKPQTDDVTDHSPSSLDSFTASSSQSEINLSRRDPPFSPFPATPAGEWNRRRQGLRSPSFTGSESHPRAVGRAAAASSVQSRPPVSSLLPPHPPPASRSRSRASSDPARSSERSTTCCCPVEYGRFSLFPNVSLHTPGGSPDDQI